jgi:demethoxyubiquinone hydroxylase (CLK1/Coq7/Cat5 family)
MEENSVYHYAIQSRLMRDESVASKFAQFSREEDIHVILLEVMIKRLGGRVYPLRWLFRAWGFVGGLLTGIFGTRFALWTNAWLERGGYELYHLHRKHALPLGDLVIIRQLDRLIREEVGHEDWLWHACRSLAINRAASVE